MRATITSPCARRWQDLAGDGRRRFCDECGQAVHAVEDYSEAEWAAVTAAGPACVYIAGESNQAPRSRRLMLAGALLTTISPLLAADGQMEILVRDESMTAHKGVAVSLTAADVKKSMARTDETGLARFVGQRKGQVQITISEPGFQIWRNTHLISNGRNSRLEATLQVGSVGQGSHIEPLPSPIKAKRR